MPQSLRERLNVTDIFMWIVGSLLVLIIVVGSIATLLVLPAAEIADAEGASIAMDLVGLNREDLVELEKARLAHSGWRPRRQKRRPDNLKGDRKACKVEFSRCGNTRQ